MTYISIGAKPDQNGPQYICKVQNEWKKFNEALNL